jgi:hypothetical protein
VSTCDGAQPAGRAAWEADDEQRHAPPRDGYDTDDARSDDERRGGGLAGRGLLVAAVRQARATKPAPRNLRPDIHEAAVRTEPDCLAVANAVATGSGPTPPVAVSRRTRPPSGRVRRVRV